MSRGRLADGHGSERLTVRSLIGLAVRFWGTAMCRADAKVLICQEFQTWCQAGGISAPNLDDCLTFFLRLESAKSPLLRFRNLGDKWQTVGKWLRNAGLVSDRARNR